MDMIRRSARAARFIMTLGLSGLLIGVVLTALAVRTHPGVPIGWSVLELPALAFAFGLLIGLAVVALQQLWHWSRQLRQ